MNTWNQTALLGYKAIWYTGGDAFLQAVHCLGVMATVAHQENIKNTRNSQTASTEGQREKQQQTCLKAKLSSLS